MGPIQFQLPIIGVEGLAASHELLTKLFQFTWLTHLPNHYSLQTSSFTTNAHTSETSVTTTNLIINDK